MEENISNIKDMLLEYADWEWEDGWWHIGEKPFYDIIKFQEEEITDGYHSFKELYHHRMKLFTIICNSSTKAWKSWKHHDGTMYDDYFIVGIGDENGYFSYHYHKDHWDEFKVNEIESAPEWNEDKEITIDELYKLL